MPTPPLAPIVKFAEGPALDAFGRLRVSVPNTKFAGQQTYDSQPLLWDHPVSGTGDASYSTNRSSTILSTGGTAAGARAMRQSKVYERYTPGQSFQVKMSAVFLYSGTHAGASQTGVWYGDDDNGIGCIHTASGFSLVRRTKTSGTVQEEIVPQTSWKFDKMNGTGVSKKNLDATKSQIFVIDVQWLGVGRVRCGFQIDGIFHFVHEFLHANVIQGVYTQSMNLPVRYEVINKDATGANVAMEAICCSVEGEGSSGSAEDAGYTFCATNDYNLISVPSTGYVPILSIRLSDLFNSKPYHGHVQLDHIGSIVQTNAVHAKILFNPTLTGASWASNGSHTGVDKDVAASGYTGGIELGCDYWAAGSTNVRAANDTSIRNILLLGKTYAGVSDIITVVGRALSGTATVGVSLNYIEQR